MKKISKKEAIPIITACAKAYKEKLAGKHFLVVYQESKTIKYREVSFAGNNYLHFTGVQTGIGARRFFERACSNRLSERDFDLDPSGKAVQKLNVLPYLSDLLYNNCMIGTFINSGIQIKAEYFIGGTKTYISVAFRDGKSTDVPVSLYNEDIRKLTRPTCKVLAIFMKDCDASQYEQRTYISKGHNISDLPDAIQSQLNLK